MSPERPTDRLLWQGRFLEVRVAPAGISGHWEYVGRVKRVGAAVIAAVTDADELVLVEQYRPPVGARCIELPAGLVGDEHDGELALESAKRELLEETGFEAARWQHVGEFASSPGLTAETFQLFRAGGLTRVAAGGGVAGEDIVVHRVPRGDLPAFLAAQRAAGRMVDCRVMFALSL